MATLEELLNIEGVVAAGEFDPDGTLVDFRASMAMSPEMGQMTAQFCATVTMMFNTLASSYTQLSGMRWVPQQGWAYSGGDWTVARDIRACSWKQLERTSTGCSGSWSNPM
jgi:roadblock/LC7 domain-containing protein